MKHARFLAAAITLCAPLAHAQDDIESDRPDFVESSKVVGKGRLQLEAGLLVERNHSGEGRERTLSTPTLLRVGIADTVELRIENEGRMVRHAIEDGARGTDAGYGDTALGLSWHAMDGGGGRPSVGVLVSAEFDSGSRAFRGKGVRPALRVSSEWELPGEVTLGVMPGIAVERDDAGHYRYGLLGIAAEKEFGERVKGFAEVALPHIAPGRHGGTEASLGVGAAYSLSKDVQFDAMLSRGLNSRTPDVAFTFGVSIRR